MRSNAFRLNLLEQLAFLALPLAVLVTLFILSLFAPGFYGDFMASETGLLEISHIGVPIIGAIFAVILIRHFFKIRNGAGIAFSVFSLLVCLYIAGEEASYGQHFFGWEVSGRMAEINDQQETNLHNISSWFDQKPRVVLELAIMLGGLLLPIFPQIMMRVVPEGLKPFAPSWIFIPTSVSVLLSRLPERLELKHHLNLEVTVRYSEKQEFFMFLFITLYLYYVWRLVRSNISPANASHATKHDPSSRSR